MNSIDVKFVCELENAMMSGKEKQLLKKYNITYRGIINSLIRIIRMGG